MFKIIYKATLIILALVGALVIGSLIFGNMAGKNITTEGGFFPSECKSVTGQTLKSSDGRKGAYKKIVRCPNSPVVSQIWLQPDLNNLKYVLLFEGEHESNDAVEFEWANPNDLIVQHSSMLVSKTSTSDYMGVSVYYQLY